MHGFLRQFWRNGRRANPGDGLQKTLDQRDALAYSPRHDALLRPCRSSVPGGPAAEAGARSDRRRPHEPHTIDAIRTLFETTRLSTREIARRTGASAATVSRRSRAGAWLRPDTGYPEDHYTPEGRRTLRRRAIAERLLRQAEHLLFQTEMNPTAKRRSLDQAVRLVRIAKKLDEEERPKKVGRKRKVPPPASTPEGRTVSLSHLPPTSET